jgi:glyoxylase-like metal-dependent hydrolase (beta-lactamase superfamily II)
MNIKILTISLEMPLRMGQVNCYLVRSDKEFLLIDTGCSTARKELLAALDQYGCTQDSLRLIALTHGDFDHTGNAAFLRDRYGARIAMHAADAVMGETGDMFAGRKRPNILIRSLVPLFTGFGKSERFSPDFLLDDGFDLSPFGLNARVLSLPGHSRGSIGILTNTGEFFCGDLFENVKGPALNSLMDDPQAARESLERLRGLLITTVYPGHGAPFDWGEAVERWLPS